MKGMGLNVCDYLIPGSDRPVSVVSSDELVEDCRLSPPAKGLVTGFGNRLDFRVVSSFTSRSVSKPPQALLHGGRPDNLAWVLRPGSAYSTAT